MIDIKIIAVFLFIVSTFLFWKFTNEYFKKEYGEKTWNKWGPRLFFWQAVLYTSAGITIVLLFLLRWIGILNF